jgi:hypothetical protein
MNLQAGSGSRSLCNKLKRGQGLNRILHRQSRKEQREQMEQNTPRVRCLKQ